MRVIVAGMKNKLTDRLLAIFAIVIQYSLNHLSCPLSGVNGTNQLQRSVACVPNRIGQL